MNYAQPVTGVFVRRPNRFIAVVEVDGAQETVHVKNTGRCAELLLPGARVVLEKAAEGSSRKTAYSLVAVYKGELLINMDSQAPNKVVYEAALAGRLDEIAGGPLARVQAEVTYGKSRFDLFWETAAGARAFLEVKGVTLEEDGIVRFPDAPTERGTKHVLEMIGAVREGYGGVIFFLIQMKGVRRFEPNGVTDPAFAEALRRASREGVRVLAYDAQVTPDGMVLGEPVEVVL
ncbi:DNA/RNA nuclease SfsA [Gorillibacterium sp. sgz5001074]|uniref:DNA/RNA nuclease SfsA n=1 Tax=Gorillibacterium sp. sgz5001074 TaxID=3446695 RepID=UPI003F66B862